MEKCASIKVAFNKIVDNLSARKRVELASELDLLRQFVEPTINPVSSFWQDSERSAQARANMRQAGQARRVKLRVSWRASGREELVDYAEVASLVSRAEMTVRIAVSKGGGTAYFMCDDDVVTVQRL